MCLYWLGVGEKWVGPHLHALHMRTSYRESLSRIRSDCARKRVSNLSCCTHQFCIVPVMWQGTEQRWTSSLLNTQGNSLHKLSPSASLQRGALEHALVPVPPRSPAAPVDTAREGSPLVGPGSLQQLGCLRMYLRTYVRMCVRIKLPRSVLHRCKVSRDTQHWCTPKT